MGLNHLLWRALTALGLGAIAANSASAQVWQDLGPGRILGYVQVGGASGRVSAIAGHPTDPNTYYLGGADGGVWKTTNDGQSWIPLTDGMPTNSVGCITIDPTNPQRIYVGTGEPNRAYHCRYGLGVYKSENGGATWVHLPRSGGVHTSTLDGRCISRIRVDPSAPNVLFAGVTRSVGDRSGKRHANGGDAIGLYKSTDFGESWSHVGTVGGTNWSCTDVAHVSGSVFLAAVWNEAVGNAKIYRSTDGGGNWAATNGDFFHRTALAVAADGLTVWALDSSSNQHRLWRSADGGQNWSLQYTQTLNSHAYETVVLTAHPTDVSKVYFGGTYNDGDLKRFVYGNGQPTNIEGHHEDMRSIDWRADGRLIIGHDGGIEVSGTVDSGQTWDPQYVDRNDKSLGITQVIPGISAYPTSGTYIFAGTQDNSGIRRVSVDPADTRIWEQTVGGGDGGANVVDTHAPVPGGPEYRIYSWPFTGAIPKPAWSDDGGTVWSGPDIDHHPPQGIGRRYQQLAVDITDPFANDFKPLFIARKPLLVGLWESQIQQFTWEERSNQLPYSVRGMAVCPHQGQTQRVYVTYNDGSELTSDVGTSWVAVSNDGGWTFSDPATPPANLEHWKFGTRDIAYDPANVNVAFCVSSRWRTGAVPSRVWFTSDGGTTWVARDGVTVSTQVTPAPVNCVAVFRLSTPQRRVVVGTDSGVWISLDDGLHWGKYGTGLPNSSVVDLVYDAPRNRLLAATLGRGIWSITAPVLVADVSGPSGEGIPDGKIDESDLVTFAEWTTGNDMEGADPTEPDQRADLGDDGEVAVDDQILYLQAFTEGW